MVNPSTHSGQVVGSHLSIRLIVEIGKVVETARSRLESRSHSKISVFSPLPSA